MIKSETTKWIKLRNCDIIDSSPSLTCLRFPKVQIFFEMFRAKVIEINMGDLLSNLFGSSIWRLVNSVNVWNLVWLSSGLIF